MITLVLRDGYNIRLTDIALYNILEKAEINKLNYIIRKNGLVSKYYLREESLC